MKPFCQHLVSDPDFATVKGGLVSEGIFTLVPPSKQCEKSLSSSSHPEVKKLRIGILHIFWGLKLKTPSEIKPPWKRGDLETKASIQKPQTWLKTCWKQVLFSVCMATKFCHPGAPAEAADKTQLLCLPIKPENYEWVKMIIFGCGIVTLGLKKLVRSLHKSKKMCCR